MSLRNSWVSNRSRTNYVYRRQLAALAGARVPHGLRAHAAAHADSVGGSATAAAHADSVGGSATAAGLAERWQLLSPLGWTAAAPFIVVFPLVRIKFKL